MIDRETEQAVERWVKLADEVAERHASGYTVCARCGSATRVLGGGSQALCTRCYLEQGSAPWRYGENARASARTSASPARSSPR